jgi:hypothetical protein
VVFVVSRRPALPFRNLILSFTMGNHFSPLRGASQIVGLLFLDFNSVFQGDSCIDCQKLETRALHLRSQLTRNFGFLKMKSVLASFFCQHQQQEAWWCKVKIAPNLASASTKVANLAPGEAPLEHCVSNFLGITMISDSGLHSEQARFKQRQRSRQLVATNKANAKKAVCALQLLTPVTVPDDDSVESCSPSCSTKSVDLQKSASSFSSASCSATLSHSKHHDDHDDDHDGREKESESFSDMIMDITLPPPPLSLPSPPLAVATAPGLSSCRNFAFNNPDPNAIAPLDLDLDSYLDVSGDD